MVFVVEESFEDYLLLSVEDRVCGGPSNPNACQSGVAIHQRV
jgi:hypothetical protein